MMDSLDAIILSKPIKIKSASSLALSSTELTESSVDLYTLWRCVLVQHVLGNQCVRCLLVIPHSQVGLEAWE